LRLPVPGSAISPSLCTSRTGPELAGRQAQSARVSRIVVTSAQRYTNGRATRCLATGPAQPGHAAPAFTDSGQRRFLPRFASKRSAAAESKCCIPDHSRLSPTSSTEVAAIRDGQTITTVACSLPAFATAATGWLGCQRRDDGLGHAGPDPAGCLGPLGLTGHRQSQRHGPPLPDTDLPQATSSNFLSNIVFRTPDIGS
jgi:hypothetical protein